MARPASISIPIATLVERAGQADVLPAPLTVAGKMQPTMTKLSTLLEPGSAAFVQQLETFANARSTDDDSVAISPLVGNIARALTAVGTYSFFTHRAVPVLDPDTTGIAWNDAGQCAMVAVSAETSVLEATAVETLVESFAGFTEPLVEVAKTSGSVGRRALWSAVATAVAAGFLTAGRNAQEQARSRDEAEAFFAAAGKSWHVRPEWISVNYEDAEHLFLLRRVCCLAYKLPEATYCSSCPLENRETRTTRLVHWLQTRASKH